MKNMTALIVAPHYDDEFFARLMLFRVFKEKLSKKIDLSVIFLSDSASTKFLSEDSFFRMFPEEYRKVRRRESVQFCRANGINILEHLMLKDGMLIDPYNHAIVNLTVKKYSNEFDIIVAPAYGEHDDHDIAHYAAKNSSDRCMFYTVHGHNKDKIKEKPLDMETFNTLVSMFYFWYPSQEESYFPSVYGGYRIVE